MPFLSSLSPEDLSHYHRVVIQSVTVRSHFDVFVWLQGDMQRYLPHDIMIVAWGNFSDGAIQHDIISALAGVRSQTSNPATLTPLLLQFFSGWNGFDHKPLALNGGDNGFLLKDAGLTCDLDEALQTMRCAMVHGITDERSSHDCLYVAFSAREHFSAAECDAMAVMLPYIDMALRRIAHLPQQTRMQTGPPSPPEAGLPQVHDLTEREAEVLCWVALGKTNPEIGNILDISEFTVKNHMQRIFKKMEVSNRAQAVGKFKTLA